MSLQKSCILLLAICALTAFALPSDPLMLKKDHGAYCHICEGLIKDGEVLGDTALDVWLDEEIGSRCKDLLLLEHECHKELKAVEKDIQEAIEKDIPADQTCKEVKLC